MWKRPPVKESCSQWTALTEVQLPTTLRVGLSQVRKLWTRRSAFLCRRETICDLGWWIRWAYARKRARPGPPPRPALLDVLPVTGTEQPEPEPDAAGAEAAEGAEGSEGSEASEGARGTDEASEGS